MTLATNIGLDIHNFIKFYITSTPGVPPSPKRVTLLACIALMLTLPRLHLATWRSIWEPYSSELTTSTTFNAMWLTKIFAKARLFEASKRSSYICLIVSVHKASACIQTVSNTESLENKTCKSQYKGKKISPILRNKHLDSNFCTKHTLLKSFVKTPDASPYSVPLALFKTPSISLK